MIDIVMIHRPIRTIMKPTVSVVIPTYNDGKRIRRAINSTLNQTYNISEIIVIDDHSEVPAREFIEDIYNENSSIRIFRHGRNKGANAARTTGMNLAHGDYIAFLDSDDEWLENKIEQQVRQAKNTNAGVIYTGITRFESSEVTDVSVSNRSGQITTDLLQGNFIGSFSTILLRADLVNTVGYPDPRLPSWQDWDYYIRLSLETKFSEVDQPLVRRYGGKHNQISDNHQKKIERTVPLFREKHLELASDLNCRDEFESAINDDLGWSAIRNTNFAEARRHFARSMLRYPSKHAVLSLAMVAGGGFTFYPTRKIYRILNKRIIYKTNRLCDDLFVL